jgi:hypothetical protein
MSDQPTKCADGMKHTATWSEPRGTRIVGSADGLRSTCLRCGVPISRRHTRSAQWHASPDAAETPTRDRITKFTDSSPASIGDRLDEIVMTGAVHLEMMGEQSAVLFVGKQMFTIYTTGRCHLHVRYEEDQR